jgi:2,3-oxidosqualene cyclase
VTSAAPIAAAPRADSAVDRSLRHLVSLQQADGCWEGEVVWNAMLVAQYVIVHRVVGSPPFAEAERARMIRHFEATRTPEGGWGMHPDSGPYVFFTTMAYVALRLLGVAAEDPLVARARTWLHTQEGVVAIPTWGKVWLSLIGLYGWEGVSPVPPELFLLPDALPFHPNRFYCHTRYIYLAIAYLYGRRFTAHLGPITAELRRELYAVPFASIDFAAHRHAIAKADLHVRPGIELRLAYDALRGVERVLPGALRKRALDHAYGRIVYELEATRFQCISPVNGLLNCLCVFDREGKSARLTEALRGVEAWRWQDEAEGVRFAGARSNAWDTAFALRAALAGEVDAGSAAATAMRRGYGYLRDTQMVEELASPGRERERRASIVGGWCFSDGRHRWPVSDCTAEALSAIVLAHEVPGLIAERERIPAERLRQATEFILDRQNDDGGFGTYERRRGGAFLEALNPSEMYGSCMTERSYLECTSSCIGALARVRSLCDRALRERVDAAVERGVALVRQAQRVDGAWAGFWGVNFTYATFHAVEGLLATGASASDPAILRAVRWLESKQKADGGWGEHYDGCLEERYVEHPESQVIMTSWALLTLLHAGETPGRAEAVRKGVAFLKAKQERDGGYPEEAVAGVFFGTAMLHYRLYKAYFPAWALGRARPEAG